MVDNGWALLKNCSEVYPISFAVEHSNYGNTWASRKSWF